MPPKKAAAAYTKTGGKDGKGRVVYVSAKGVERVRCRSAATGKAEWRKPAAVSAGGGERGDHEEDFGPGTENRNPLAKLYERLNVVNAGNRKLNESMDKLDERINNEKLPQVKASVELLNKNIAGLRKCLENPYNKQPTFGL